MSEPLPWYVAGPLIGLTVPVLRLLGRSFGVSANLRHLCAAVVPGRVPFLHYDWKKTGLWNLVFAAGILLGGVVSSTFLLDTVVVSDATYRSLTALGLSDFSGIVPAELFGLAALKDPIVLSLLIVGGFLVGFGSRYAGGCTSGHAIAGLAELQLPSLVAVLGFFAGGLVTTHLVLPWILA